MLNRFYKTVLLFVFGLLAGVAGAQSTIVTMTVVNNGQSYVNGTYSFIFKPLAGFPGNSQWQGADLPSNYLVVTAGLLDSSGSASFVLPSNTAITPTGSSWNITVCPAATVPCTTVPVTVSGTTQDISSTINGFLNPISTNGQMVPLAYQDSQVTTAVRQGSMYFNTTSNVPRIYNGTSWQNFAGGGANPAGIGTNQFSNSSTTALVSGGIVNTDALGGVEAAYVNTCGPTTCVLTIPPTTSDTFSALPLVQNSTTNSSLVIDNRYNSEGLYATNPGSNQWIPNGPIQSLRPSIVTYTAISPAPDYGDAQNADFLDINFNYAGFSYGNAGCPDYCPPPGYTNVAPWNAPRVDTKFISYYGSGIHEGMTYVNNFYSGAGDDQVGYWYSHFSGGCTSPGDECGKVLGMHEDNNGDASGTVVSTSSPTDYVVNITSNTATQGQDRFLIDVTNVIALNAPLSAVTDPVGATPGTATFNTITLPVSPARGHTTQACTVPTQASASTSVVCSVVVDYGQFGVSTSSTCGPSGNQPCGIAAEVYFSGGENNLGMQVTAAGGISGGAQSLTMLVHRTIPAGALLCQGGMASTSIELFGDSQSLAANNTPVSVDAPVFCSLPDTHTVQYAIPNSSQSWAGLIGNNSQQVTTGLALSVPFGGSYLMNLVRDGVGNVIGTITSGNTTGQQLSINGQRFWSISCPSDSSFNITSNPVAISLEGSDLSGNTAKYTQTGSAGSCTGATYTPQIAVASLFKTAVVYDVMNHTTGAVDGTLFTSYNPGIAAGDSIKIPTNISAAYDGQFLVQSIAQPSFVSNSYDVLLEESSALRGSTAYNATNIPTANQQFTLGGYIPNANWGQALGTWHNGFVMQLAPDPTGFVIEVGPASNLCTIVADGNSCPLVQTYGIIGTVNGFSRLMYSENNNQWQWFVNNQPVMTNGLSGSTINNSLFTDNPVFRQMDLGTTVETPQTQIRSLASLSGAGGPLGYDNYIPAPTVTAGSSGPNTAFYEIVVNYTYGRTASLTTALFNAPVTPNNTISCSVIPASSLGTGSLGTGEVYVFSNPSWLPVGSCTSPAASVLDNGVYGTPISSEFATSGALLPVGGVLAYAGGYGFASNTLGIFNGQTAGFSQLVDGVISADGINIGDGQGSMNMKNLTVTGTCTGCGGGGGGGVTTINGVAGGFTFTGSGVTCVTTTCTFNSAAVAFGGIGSGTNSVASMIVASGATVTFTSGGIINASGVDGVTVTGTPTSGQGIIATSGTTAAWATISPTGAVLLAPSGSQTISQVTTSFLGVNWLNRRAYVDGFPNSGTVSGTACASQSDCAWLTALGYSNFLSNSVDLVYGALDAYVQNMTYIQPTSSFQAVNLIGAGRNATFLQTNTSLGANAMLQKQGTNTAYFIIRDMTLNANNNANSCIDYIKGITSGGEITNVSCANVANGSDHYVEIGDGSDFGEDLNIQGLVINQPYSNPTQASLTPVMTGTALTSVTVVSGGNYSSSGPTYGVAVVNDPFVHCTVEPTLTPVFTGTALTSITVVTGGTCPGGLAPDVVVTLASATTYAFKFFVSDSSVDHLTPSGARIGLFTEGSNTVFNHMHCITMITCTQVQGGDVFVGTELDTIASVGFEILNTSFSQGSSFIGTTAVTDVGGKHLNGSVIFQFDASTNIANFSAMGPLCNSGASPDYQEFVLKGVGPAAPGSTNWPAKSTIYGNDQSCITMGTAMNTDYAPSFGAGILLLPALANSPNIGVNSSGQVVATTGGTPRVASGFCTGVASSSTTIGLNDLGVVSGTTTCTQTRSATNSRWMMNGTGTLQNLKMRCATTGVNSSSGVLTLNVTHTATSSTFTPTGLTVTYGTSTANSLQTDSTHTFAYSDGDLLTVALTTQATETLGTCNVSVQF